MSQTRLRSAVVVAIKEESLCHQEVRVKTQDNEVAVAMCYSDLTGRLSIGDRVIINTAAVALDLGTGGYHFVLARQDSPQTGLNSDGHAMKLRYTPLQFCCSLIEEQMGHSLGPNPLSGMPVAICELHSQLPLVLAGIRARLPHARLAYVLTEGGALPASFSHLLRHLKSSGLVDVVLSSGQAFGGDHEAVNVYSALVASRSVAECDAAVVGMGPGQLGSGTPLGFSGTEQADSLNRVSSLGGIPIAVLRLSGHDPRNRHHGVSHHTLTILNRLTLARCFYAFPRELRKDVYWQGQRARIHDQHWSWEVRGTPAVEYLRRYGLAVETMGRPYQTDPVFFLAAGAAGGLVAQFLKCKVRRAKYTARGSRRQDPRKARISLALP